MDERDASVEGEADAPVAFDVALNENDPIPSAGGADVGGVAGGQDDAADGGSDR